jgi:hypothetical protein
MTTPCPHARPYSPMHADVRAPGVSQGHRKRRGRHPGPTPAAKKRLDRPGVRTVSAPERPNRGHSVAET